MRSWIVVCVVVIVSTSTRADAKPKPRPAAKARPTQLSVGANHACARMSDGTARCWGDNSESQLGDGTALARSGAVTPPLTDVVEIAAGESFTCARRADRTVWGWGWNAYGELGSGATGDTGPAP